MAKKKRNHNSNLIKVRHSYTFIEIAETLKIHPRTVQSWRKQGLEVIDEASNPYLVYGAELRQFLRAKRQKQRHPLKAGEFYCPKCQLPRKSLPDKLAVIITDKRLGKTSRQAFIKGICEVCHTHLTLFSSDKKAQEWQEKALPLVEHSAELLGIEDSSYNNDIERDEKCLN